MSKAEIRHAGTNEVSDSAQIMGTLSSDIQNLLTLLVYITVIMVNMKESWNQFRNRKQEADLAISKNTLTSQIDP